MSGDADLGAISCMIDNAVTPGLEYKTTTCDGYFYLLAMKFKLVETVVKYDLMSRLCVEGFFIYFILKKRSISTKYP